MSNFTQAACPDYDGIVAKYRKLVLDSRAEGRSLNKKQFWLEEVAPKVRDYPYKKFFGWTLAHARKMKDVRYGAATDGIEVISKNNLITKIEVKGGVEEIAESTRQNIALALKIGAEAMKEIEANPELVPAKDRALLGFQAMRAQDSRIGALAVLKREKREDLSFQQSFGDAAYESGEDLYE